MNEPLPPTPNKNYRPGRSRRPVRTEVYFQTTDFTCGPASLMMAMASLDPDYLPSRLEELRIWREANLIFMGNGHAGCGPYGLARAAMRRGFSVAIYEHQAENLFKVWTRNAEEAAVQTMLDDYDRQRALDQGCVIEQAPLTRTLITELIAQDKQLITLTSNNLDGHWVIIHDLVDQDVFIIDPDEDYAGKPRKGYKIDSGHSAVQHRNFKSWVKYGPHESTALIALGPRSC